MNDLDYKAQEHYSARLEATLDSLKMEYKYWTDEAQQMGDNLPMPYIYWLPIVAWHWHNPMKLGEALYREYRPFIDTMYVEHDYVVWGEKSQLFFRSEFEKAYKDVVVNND